MVAVLLYPWLAPFSSSRPQPSVNSDAIAQYLKSLHSVPSSTPSTLSAPERSAIDKIADATGKARKAISEEKVTKAIQVEWVSRLILFLKPIYGKAAPLVGVLEQWRKEIAKTQLAFDDFQIRVQQVEHFLSSLRTPGGAGSFVVASRSSLVPATENVFIIHGRDEVNQLRLSKLVREDFDLSPVVLLDKPGRSAPTIDKFEEHAQVCSFAIALFTADDKVISKSGEEYWQPRPNVIYETGWFVGRLGKERVLILLQEDVKIYSDFDGVNRIQFRSDVDDKFRQIRAELAISGLIKITDRSLS